MREGSHVEAFCDLCRKLNNNTIPEKSYASVRSWWKRGACAKKGYRNYG